MAKRKLNKQQERRLQENQQQVIEDSLSTGELQNGVVIANLGASLIIEGKSQRQHNCQFRQNLGSIVAGDQVVFDHDSMVVVAREPRSSLLERPNQKGQTKGVAANVTQMLIVLAAKPAPSQTTLDNYLVAAHNAGIKAIIIINKSDLPKTKAKLEIVSELYPTLGYEVLKTSTTKEEGIEELQNLLQDNTSIIVGQSGVGKSSLVKSLLPSTTIAIGAISENVALGKHTTSVTTLYHLPRGGALIDSPGIRQFGLWNLPKEAIEQAYIEFAPYLGRCQFRNCLHVNDAGCALLKALDDEAIHPERLENFISILSQFGV